MGEGKSHTKGKIGIIKQILNNVERLNVSMMGCDFA
jgi:hypothetical protein